MKLALAVVALLCTTELQAQPYDDAALMKQMGFVAGQAVACGIDQSLVANAVTSQIIDAMGDDDEASRNLVHVALEDAPALAAAGDVGPVLLGGPQRLFLCRSPSRRSAA